MRGWFATGATKTTIAGGERQLQAFIRKFNPKDQRLIRAVRDALHTRFPTANELVYGNYNCLLIGYSPMERPAEPGAWQFRGHANSKEFADFSRQDI